VREELAVVRVVVVREVATRRRTGAITAGSVIDSAEAAVGKPGLRTRVAISSPQGTLTVGTPGGRSSITPPQLHISFDVLFSAGIFPIMTVGAPTAHGAAVFGMHGIGVSTPSAAAVAAATIGLAGL
jgi:hypothetical protein